MSAIGQGLARIDGPLKLTGSAKYSSDHNFANMLYGIGVGSSIASGRVTSIDAKTASKMPGVIEIFYRDNMPALYKSSPEAGPIDESRPPFADDVIRYYGQYVALVIAETFEQAVAAAACVTVTYADVRPPNVSLELTADDDPQEQSRRGNPEAAFAAADARVDQTYVTPVQTHNAIELHASVAVPDGEQITLYNTTQAVVNSRNVLSEMLGQRRENVRVIMKFLGSGFGAKLWVWPHELLAAAAARRLGRPVKLVLSRKQNFESAGHRARTQQRVRMSAGRDGTLTSLRQDYVNHRSLYDEYQEDCGEVTPFFYGTPNLLVTNAQTKRNVGAPTAMRGPGAVPGLFAIESAYDELARVLDIDPVELRIRNEPERDQEQNIPFSSRHYIECLTLGAEKFGWSQRTAGVGSMRRGDAILGWGMAGCSWLAARFAAEARVELRADGSAFVGIATQDIGTGTYTVLAQLVAAVTGIAVERVIVEIGDTNLPPGPTSGGSMATASVVPAVNEAARMAMKAAIGLATGNGARFAGHSADELEFKDGYIVVKDSPADRVAFQEVLTAAAVALVSGSGKGSRTFGEGPPDRSAHSYGAHFVEVTWQPQTARLRVARIVTVIDGGTIINPRTARNQIHGSLVMGVGMALFERTTYDARSGAPINSNLADYVVATNADAPSMDVTFLDYPDTYLNEHGARGIGEIGLAGVAAAITSAVYHATGVRVRELPVTIEALL
ncbi:MAG: xanthine dehydrogenase family protein molybdopterin-binding subunit [Candidatus Eremiobacteraeota bacterium]|nr:xanthine dehydrogenase family protein molybdopterin-binding subunit [Candidatus Eremiobacteraeota bacterium]